ncbi:hypothetical protein ACIHCX_37935 [Streptomyces sp. NPDC052043]|uniref:hypothetical protein n=1 Tax=Streptomyces sp. NPDC052043 TaxID=3365684 RepID=UPI0037CD02FC
MTSYTASSSFVPAPDGWRIAIGDPQDKDIMVVPVIGWQSVTGGATETSIAASPVEPVVLFDNTKDPIISTVHATIESWSNGAYVHQVLAPGVTLRDVPEGWKVVDPYQG